MSIHGVEWSGVEWDRMATHCRLEMREDVSECLNLNLGFGHGYGLTSKAGSYGLLQTGAEIEILEGIGMGSDILISYVGQRRVMCILMKSDTVMMI
jgi:hypothetical protein